VNGQVVRTDLLTATDIEVEYGVKTSTLRSWRATVAGSARSATPGAASTPLCKGAATSTVRLGGSLACPRWPGATLMPTDDLCLRSDPASDGPAGPQPRLCRGSLPKLFFWPIVPVLVLDDLLDPTHLGHLSSDGLRLGLRRSGVRRALVALGRFLQTPSS